MLTYVACKGPPALLALCWMLNPKSLFTLADRHGTVLDNPPLPEEIAGDPVLGALKLVAWSGNDKLLPRGGDRGARAPY